MSDSPTSWPAAKLAEISERPLRYVALGDSQSEGVGDEAGTDGEFIGWTDRLAHALAATRPIEYANLAVRGLKAGQILETQVEPALEMHADLVTLTSGVNDVLRPKVDLAAVRELVAQTIKPFVDQGALVVMITVPDITKISPIMKTVAPRLQQLNAMYRELAEEYGFLLVDSRPGSIFEDARAWAPDRLHLGPLGHTRVAAGLALALGVDADEAWEAALVDAPPKPSIKADALWAKAYFGPWVMRRLRGRSSADGRSAKRPHLELVTNADTSD